MMMLSRTQMLLASLFLAVIQISAGHEEATTTEMKINVDGSLRHNGNLNQSRELWGYGRQWSFSNIMFHLGICHADADCEEEHHLPGPLHCGCPDCTKPHPPHFQNSYCENLASASDESDSSTESSAEEAVATDATDSVGNRGQSANRSFSWLYLVAAGAAVGMVGAAVYAQRKRSQSLDERSMPLNGERSSNANMFGIAAASAAFGAVLMKMGLKKDDKGDTDSDDDASVGSVASRKQLMERVIERGLRAPPVYDDNTTPSFVPIPKDASNPNISQTTEGVEVGEYSPSGVRYQGSRLNQPSTPCMV